MKITIIVLRRRVAPAPPVGPAHSESCIARRAPAAAYAQAWPQFCRRCHGVGVVSDDFDPSAAGVRLGAGAMTATEPCTCVMDDRCPRCAQSLLGSWWRHPRRRLATAMRSAIPDSVRVIDDGMHHAITPALYAASSSARLRTVARARLTPMLLVPGQSLGDTLWDLAERVAPLPGDETPPCPSCGWTGHAAGDVQPFWECRCADDQQDAIAAAVAAGTVCWRCERPFDPAQPGVQTTIPSFGTRWLHPGCVLDDDLPSRHC